MTCLAEDTAGDGQRPPFGNFARRCGILSALNAILNFTQLIDIGYRIWNFWEERFLFELRENWNMNFLIFNFFFVSKSNPVEERNMVSVSAKTTLDWKLENVSIENKLISVKLLRCSNLIMGLPEILKTIVMGQIWLILINFPWINYLDFETGTNWSR